MKEAVPELNASSSEAEEEKEEQPKVVGEKDPDFSQVNEAPLCLLSKSILNNTSHM